MRYSRLRVLLITGVVSTAPTIAHTQSLTDVRPGTRVQLVMRDSLRQAPILPARQMVVGQFVRAGTDSVWLRLAGASELGVARITVTRASASRGASRLRSALTFGAGLGVGFAVAVALDGIDTGRDYATRDHRTRDALIAGGVGLGGGMLVGALSPYEHWRRLRP